MRERMRAIFVAIDSWVIARCEAFSHWTQRNFGLTSATWERWSLLLAVWVVALRLPGSGFDKVLLGFLGLHFITAFFRDRYSRRDGDVIARNPGRLEQRGWRIFSLYLAVTFVPLIIVDHDPWYQLLVLGKYFALCDDLPPGKSRLKEWLKSLTQESRG